MKIPDGAHEIHCSKCFQPTAYHQTHGKPCAENHQSVCAWCEKHPDRIKLPIEWGGGLHPIGDKDPLTRLLGDISIGGRDFHIEAWQVEENELGEQRCVDSSIEDWYDYITGNLTEGAGQTVEIDGRHYFIVVTPFQE